MISDEVLMLAFQRGSREAFDELYVRYRRPLYGFFRRRLNSEGRAEDLAQDRARLDALLLDPQWLEAKLTATASAAALVADYDAYGVGEAQSLLWANVAADGGCDASCE